ncbi:integrin like protein [Prevotella sp. CAG:1124]|nr:integrin like protein [Prevotella sp. CAG:1124]
MDIVYAGESADNFAVVALNGGNGTFTAHNNLLNKARGGAAVAAFDINNTGTPDIAIMGYNDNGDGHFNVWNGLVSRAQNVAPAAPANAVMSEADGKVTFTWDAATDDHTPAAALRYNVYVRLKDGKVITLVPADPETGKLRLGDVNAATTARTYTLNITSDKIADWGVQAIDGGKLASAFTKGTTTGISNIVAGENSLDVTCAGGVITVSTDADVTVTDIAGRTVLRTKAAAGTPVDTNLGAGIYVVKAQAGKDSVAKKVIIR